ncbi:DUF488 family protein [uncultured Bacteroides sp.]|uniref:DUF488 domain-containing protein n=1 Tax=uncultured Bacteroides sp. TaxID=162156 RepID=UPI00258E46CC|nr:DUF488 family protein [uncultured Bacteroides sp.]
MIEVFGGHLTAKQLQKYLFLFTRKQEEKAYDFIPYYYGCFSFQANQDIMTLSKLGYLSIIRDENGRRIQIVKPGNYILMLDMFEQHAIKEIRDMFGQFSQSELIRYTYVNYPYYATKSVIAKDLLNETELSIIEKQKRKFVEPKLFTIGYEGRSLEKYMNILIINDVHVLCDVRKNAFSQKYGFSKSQLEKACSGVGIKYIHVPQLGIESEYRQDLRTQKDYDILFDVYEKTTLKENWNYLLYVRQVIDEEKRIALTCFEENPMQCHRSRVAKYLMKLPNINFILKHL